VRGAVGEQEHEGDLAGGGLGFAGSEEGVHGGLPQAAGAAGVHCRAGRGQQQPAAGAAQHTHLVGPIAQGPQLDDVGFGARVAGQGEPVEQPATFGHQRPGEVAGGSQRGVGRWKATGGRWSLRNNTFYRGSKATGWTYRGGGSASGPATNRTGSLHAGEQPRSTTRSRPRTW
jgi:hypothetical protein